MSDKSPFVVSPDWLAKHLKDPGLSIVDASWYLPAQNRDARAEYDAAHIPGAVFFDQDEVVDPGNPLPHTLPPPTVFEQHASAMGISRDDTIIVYDGPGMFTAPRVWWMFRTMGARNVFILDGGFDNSVNVIERSGNQLITVATIFFLVMALGISLYVNFQQAAETVEEPLDVVSLLVADNIYICHGSYRVPCGAGGKCKQLPLPAPALSFSPPAGLSPG